MALRTTAPSLALQAGSAITRLRSPLLPAIPSGPEKPISTRDRRSSPRPRHSPFPASAKAPPRLYLLVCLRLSRWFLRWILDSPHWVQNRSAQQPLRLFLAVALSTRRFQSGMHTPVLASLFSAGAPAMQNRARIVALCGYPCPDSSRFRPRILAGTHFGETQRSDRTCPWGCSRQACSSRRTT